MSQTTILFSNSLPIATFGGCGKRVIRVTAAISVCPRKAVKVLRGSDAERYDGRRIGSRQGGVGAVLYGLGEVPHRDEVPVAVDGFYHLSDQLPVLRVDLAFELLDLGGHLDGLVWVDGEGPDRVVLLGDGLYQGVEQVVERVLVLFEADYAPPDLGELERGPVDVPDDALDGEGDPEQVFLVHQQRAHLSELPDQRAPQRYDVLFSLLHPLHARLHACLVVRQDGLELLSEHPCGVGHSSNLVLEDEKCPSPRLKVGLRTRQYIFPARGMNAENI